MSRGGLAALPSALLGFGIASSAAASDLSWSGPADCAQSEQLLFQVEQALGAPLADTGSVHMQVHVARTAPTARALLRIEDEAAEPALSERSLVAPDCGKLVDTLAVAITLALEAAAPPRVVPASPLRAPTPAALADASSPSPPPDVVVPSQPDGGAAPGPVARVVARVLGDVGSLPAPALGVGLGGQLGWSRLRLELLGTLWSEQHTSLDASQIPGAGAEVMLVTGTLSACTTPLGADPVVLGLCLGWEMGRLSALGTGISAPRRANAPWLAPGANVELGWRPTHAVGLGVQLGAAVPLARSEFYLERLGTVHQATSVVARASLSLDVAFE